MLHGQRFNRIGNYMLNKEEMNNLRVLVETGAKAISHDKSLTESVEIQNTAVELLKKIEADNQPEGE
jgi:hypothetical protein